MESFSYRPLFLEHSSFLCHLGSVKYYAVVCSNVVHYYINSVNTNGDGSSNYSINNTSGMWAAFNDIQEDSLNRDFPVPFWRKKCLFCPFGC